MKAFTRLGVPVALLSLSFLGGCVSFANPVGNPTGEQLDLSPYTGTWRAEQEPETAITLEPVLGGSNALRGSSSSVSTDYPSPPMTFNVILADVDGRIIASVDQDQDFGSNELRWFIGAVELNDEGTRMTIRSLDEQVVAEAVESGDFEAPTPEPGVDDDGVPPPIAVYGTTLRDFLSDHPDAFDRGEETVLVRGEPIVATVGPEQDFLPTEPTEISVEGGAEPMYDDQTGRSAPGAPGAPEAPYATGYGYPGGPMPEQPWSMPPTNPGQSPMGGPAGALPPYGAGSAIAADAGTPAPVKGIVTWLALLIVVGVASALGVNYVKQRQWDARHASDGSAVDGDRRGGVRMGDEDADARRQSRTAALIRRYAWPALLVLAVALGPILYLTVLLKGLTFAEQTLGLRPGALAMLRGSEPYVLVFSIGAMIAVAEVATTFPTFSAEALSTKWAALLVAFNGLGNVIVCSVVMAYSERLDHPLIRALGISAGFAVLIRTRFVLARDLRAGEASEGIGERAGRGARRGMRDGVSIDLGWPYGRIQRMCRQGIDRDLLRNPRYATTRLLLLFPDAAQMHKVAVDSIKTNDPSVAPELQSRLDAIYAQDIDPGVVRARVARFVAETGGVGHTRFLIEHANPDDAV